MDVHFEFLGSGAETRSTIKRTPSDVVSVRACVRMSDPLIICRSQFRLCHCCCKPVPVARCLLCLSYSDKAGESCNNPHCISGHLVRHRCLPIYVRHAALCSLGRSEWATRGAGMGDSLGFRARRRFKFYEFSAFHCKRSRSVHS